MARKATKLVKHMVDRHIEVVKHYTNVIAAKERGDENPFYKDKSISHFESLATGQAMMLETLLHESGCYMGFQHVNKNLAGPIKDDHPEYAEWRRIYFIKE